MKPPEIHIRTQAELDAYLVQPETASSDYRFMSNVVFHTPTDIKEVTRAIYTPGTMTIVNDENDHCHHYQFQSLGCAGLSTHAPLTIRGNLHALYFLEFYGDLTVIGSLLTGDALSYNTAYLEVSGSAKIDGDLRFDDGDFHIGGSLEVGGINGQLTEGVVLGNLIANRSVHLCSLTLISDQNSITGELKLDGALNRPDIYEREVSLLAQQGKWPQAAPGLKVTGAVLTGDSIDMGSLEAHSVLSLEFRVNCRSLRTGERGGLPFGPSFWLAQPPLAPFRQMLPSETLIDSGVFFERMRILPNPKQICAWPGWHPLLRAQLEMFFGLKRVVCLDGSEPQPSRLTAPAGRLRMLPPARRPVT